MGGSQRSPVGDRRNQGLESRHPERARLRRGVQRAVPVLRLAVRRKWRSVLLGEMSHGCRSGVRGCGQRGYGRRARPDV